MGEKWRANVHYGPPGTKVEYQGILYELIQAHTSQIGWEPGMVPALWRVCRNQEGVGHHRRNSSCSTCSGHSHRRRHSNCSTCSYSSHCSTCSGHSGHGGHGGHGGHSGHDDHRPPKNQNNQHNQQSSQQQNQNQNQQNQQNQNQQNQNQNQQQNQNQPSFPQPFQSQGQKPEFGQPPFGQPPFGQPPYGQPHYGFQPPYGDQPPQYNQYNQQQQNFNQYGQPPYGFQPPPFGQFPSQGYMNNAPYEWVPYSGGIPQNAVGVLNDKLKKTFYVGRAEPFTGVHPGYVDPDKEKCYVCYNDMEIVCDKFEILVCDPSKYRWIPCKDPGRIDGNPVIGGFENDGTNYYVCKCMNKNIAYFGKTDRNSLNAVYGLSGKQISTNDFEVLTYV